MTQEYIPSDEAVKLKFAGLEIPELIRATRAENLHGSDEDEKLFERWLAAHDARIRAEARRDLLKDSEITVFAEAMFDELEDYGFFACGFTDCAEAYENAFEDSENGLYGYRAVEAGINAVNQLRETPKEEEQ